MRVGLIGCGEIGRLRAAAVQRLPSWKLQAVCDADRSRATAVAAVPQSRVENQWRDLAAADDIDLVIVSTPPSSHAEIAIEALRRGKHVLCEKPLA
ncbi:MAG: Gfo/Idh/MocA family protein, partial [Bryobacteraceae bacterium]